MKILSGLFFGSMMIMTLTVRDKITNKEEKKKKREI